MKFCKVCHNILKTIFINLNIRDIAFGREVNRLSRRITEKSFNEIFPAEYYLRTAESPNGRPLFSRIFILANVEKLNRKMFDSLFIQFNSPNL